MKKKLGSSRSFVHGKEKEIICHDMRKYVWQKYNFLQNIKKKKRKSARSSIGLERLTTDQEVRGATPLGRTKFKNYNYLIILSNTEVSCS